MRGVELRLGDNIYLRCQEISQGVLDLRQYTPKPNRNVTADISTCVEVVLKDGTCCYMTKAEIHQSSEVMYVSINKQKHRA